MVHEWQEFTKYNRLGGDQVNEWNVSLPEILQRLEREGWEVFDLCYYSAGRSESGHTFVNIVARRPIGDSK